MDLAALRLFVAVAQRGSFSGVARAQDAEPSSVSRIVGGLEQELGFRLFQRTTRRMTLTEAGALYLHRVEALLEELEQAREHAAALSGGPAGTLRLTASVAFGTTRIVPLLPAFRAAHAAVAVELLLSDSNIDLVGERIDLAIRLAPSVQADVVGVKLMDTRYHVCATPGWLAAGAPARPEDLSAHDCLLFALPDYRSRWLFRDSSGQVTMVPVHGAITTTNALALLAATRLGMGPALLPDWLVAQDLASGALRDLFPAWRATATDFTTAAWLLYPSRAFLPAKVRVAIDFLRAAMAG